jgi:hypothetical protein
LRVGIVTQGRAAKFRKSVLQKNEIGGRFSEKAKRGLTQHADALLRKGTMYCAPTSKDETHAVGEN